MAHSPSSPSDFSLACLKHPRYPHSLGIKQGYCPAGQTSLHTLRVNISSFLAKRNCYPEGTQKADAGTNGWHFGSTGAILRMTLCSLPIGQKTFGKQRTKPPDLAGWFTLDASFGENEFLIERVTCF